MKETEKRKHTKIIVLVIVLVLLVLGGGIAGFIYWYADTLVYRSCTVEAGVEVSVADFLRRADENAFFTPESDEIDTAVPGDYHLFIKSGFFTEEAVLHVQDTIPPTGTAVPQELEWEETCTVEDCVTDIADATAVTVQFEEEPDFTQDGTQQVTILLTDLGGNVTRLQTEIYITPPDTEPPVITGAEDIYYTMGDTVSYRKNVTVTDNSGEVPNLQIDTSQVKLDAEGIYPVTYSAKDSSGNETSVTVNIYVSPKSYSIEEVYQYADAVLAKIFTEDMTPYDKLWQIYTYVQRNVAYINHSEKNSWVQAAYEGLVKKKGDCYVFASTTKVLLDRAGITNMDIAKIPARTQHFWNLVDIGDGWYHLDTTPRKDHPTIFYWDDATLMAYSAKHNNSHNYDHDAYPQVN